MKLFLAAYYLRMYGGYDRTPQGTGIACSTC